MVRFRPGLWLIDLGSVALMRVFWQVVPGLIMRAFFDLVTGDAPVRLGIRAIVALLVASEIGRAIGRYGFVFADVPLFAHVTTLLRRNLLNHILSRPGASTLPDSPGEAVSRFRGDVREIPLFAIWLNDILIGIAVVAIAVVTLGRISVPITLVALAPSVLIGIASNAASSRIGKYRKASRRAAGRVTGFLGETFGAVQAVKVATAEDSVGARFEALNDERRKVSLKDRLFEEIFRANSQGAVNLGIGVVLMLSGQAMQEGSFTVGDFALYVYYLETISSLTTFAAMMVARYKQLDVSVQRMGRLMESVSPDALVEPAPVYLDGPLPEVIYEAKTDEHALQTLNVTDLTYCYPGSDRGIQDVSFRLNRGTLTVITGQVGSGKTTLLRVLLGLLPAKAGEIRWNGQVVRDPGAFFVPPRAAYTAQVPRLFSNSLRNNILLGLGADERELARALRLAVLETDVAGFEHGLETPVGPKGVKLSGGQIQRAAAARMFARDPELLVFDDLSSALDVETEHTLWERVFGELDTTCLVVSHHREALSRADHIIVLKEGQVEAEGRLQELLEECGEMRRLWHGDAALGDPRR
jgi:ATP-binding cassette subfamily B protein